MGLKEITVFSVGDSNSLKTWSNVPYFFTKTFEEKGVKVNRVNIEENRWLNLVYKYSVYAVLKALYKDSAHTYFRSGLNYYLTGRKIKNAIKKYPASEANFFLTFSFSAAHHSSKTTVLFGDWTYLYYIRNFYNRESYWFERRALKREKQHIDSANLVLGLFPLSGVFIKQNYTNKNCHYLGNVINANYPLQKEKLLLQKTGSKKILFIGNKKYLAGAVELINAFKEISSKNKEAELHLIGLVEQETGLKLPNVYYHGYLDKGVPSQNEIYYKLISEARLIVNTNAGWGAFSAMTEAMYYFTPVITSPYNEFTETYGNEIKFGSYARSSDRLTELIEQILNNSAAEQTTLMLNAHEAAKDFTWSNYVGRVLGLMNHIDT